MNLYAWDHVPEEHLNPMLTRQVIHGEKMTVARFHLQKGCALPPHSHVNEQCSIIQSGRLHFIVGDEEAMLQAGDMIMMPSDVPHSVEALEESLVLDFFSPARHDWQQGADAYLRR